jgi:hypothetical protein
VKSRPCPTPGRLSRLAHAQRRVPLGTVLSGSGGYLLTPRLRWPVQAEGSAVGTWRVAHNDVRSAAASATSAALCWLVADLSHVDDQRAAPAEAHWLRYGLESASRQELDAGGVADPGVEWKNGSGLQLEGFAELRCQLLG